MRNHFHLVLETPKANLVAGRRWLLSACTIRSNHRPKLLGHVFSGRYKALLVDGGSRGYLRTVCDYVHLNPARAGLLAAEERLLAYPRSSLGWYLAALRHRPQWIRVDRLLGEHGIRSDRAEARQEFERQMEARRLEATEEKAVGVIRRGWCLGSSEFREQMLPMMEGKLGENHAGALHRETAGAVGGRIMAEELGRRGWDEAELAARRKRDPGKPEIAVRLRKESTLSIKEIAALVHLGTSKSAKARLHEWRNKAKAAATTK